jgi:hypothetical protein
MSTESMYKKFNNKQITWNVQNVSAGQLHQYSQHRRQEWIKWPLYLHMYTIQIVIWQLKLKLSHCYGMDKLFTLQFHD